MQWNLLLYNETSADISVCYGNLMLGTSNVFLKPLSEGKLIIISVRINDDYSILLLLKNLKINLILLIVL